jgi:HrpA-like RNA helicase
VTEQLAGFRRRALAAELRARELEQAVAAAEQAARASTSQAGALDAARAESRAQAARLEALEQQLAAAKAAPARIEALEQQLAEAKAYPARIEALEQALAEAQQASEAALRGAARPAEGANPSNRVLKAENAALRERLGEAVERTRVIAERVRFLRQQLGNGVEK